MVYAKTSIGGANYYAFQITKGNSSVYGITGEKYLVNSNNSQARIVDLNQKSNKLGGTLSVIYSDCLKVRELIANSSNINESELKTIAETYNTCEYKAYEPTLDEVLNANKSRNDKVAFFIGAGIGLSSVKFEENGESDGYASSFFQIGVQGFPAFSREKLNRLSFSAQLQYWLGARNDYTNTTFTRDYKVTSARLLIGTEYTFLTQKTLQPFLGLNLGISSDTYHGTLGGSEIKINKGNTLYGFTTGVNFQFDQSRLNVAATYFPETKTNVRTRVSPSLIVYNTTLSIGVNYFF